MLKKNLKSSRSTSETRNYGRKKRKRKWSYLDDAVYPLNPAKCTYLEKNIAPSEPTTKNSIVKYSKAGKGEISLGKKKNVLLSLIWPQLAVGAKRDCNYTKSTRFMGCKTCWLATKKQSACKVKRRKPYWKATMWMMAQFLSLRDIYTLNSGHFKCLVTPRPKSSQTFVR